MNQHTNVCKACGQPLGHCAVCTHYPDGHSTPWRAMPACVNRECAAFGRDQQRVKAPVATNDVHFPSTSEMKQSELEDGLP